MAQRLDGSPTVVTSKEAGRAMTHPDPERPEPQDPPDEAPETPTDEPQPVPVQDPPAEPSQPPYVVTGGHGRQQQSENTP